MGNLEAGNGVASHEAHGQHPLCGELGDAARHLHSFHASLHAHC